jgi:hypothetical protein
MISDRTTRHALSCQWSQALVQYSNAAEAASAKASLEGHAIYDGGYNRVGSWLDQAAISTFPLSSSNDENWKCISLCLSLYCRSSCHTPSIATST